MQELLINWWDQLHLAASYVRGKALFTDILANGIKWNVLGSPPLPFKGLSAPYIRMLGQLFKLAVDLLSFFLNPKLKHCSQMTLNS